MIALIDYGAGNLGSVLKACKYIGCQIETVDTPEKLLKADAAILPGVGFFGDIMNHLNRTHMADGIKDFIKTGKPFLGICIGLQVLFDSSEESEGISGLGIMPGKILKFPNDKNLKIPQIGWNSLNIKKNSILFKGLPKNPYFYFVHSYYLNAQNRESVIATSDYATTFDAACEYKNIFATQFHPEKSGDNGLTVLKNFASIIKEDI